MLSKNQIRFLKAQAHHLHPVVLIGANGISEGVDREVNRALDDIQAEMIDHIAQTHHAEFVQKIGHIAVFYRRNAEQAKIVLPKD